MLLRPWRKRRDLKSIGQHANSPCINKSVQGLSMQFATSFIKLRALNLANRFTARMWLRVIIDSLTLLTCRKAFLEGRCTKSNYGSTYANIRYNSINTLTITVHHFISIWSCPWMLGISSGRTWRISCTSKHTKQCCKNRVHCQGAVKSETVQWQSQRHWPLHGLLLQQCQLPRELFVSSEGRLPPRRILILPPEPTPLL